MNLQEIAGYKIPLAFPPSKNQMNVGLEIVNGSRNIVVDSKAGTGKTTLIQMMTRLIYEVNPKARVLVMAFNEKIVAEITPKMPTEVNCMTSHSLGKAIINNHLRKRAQKTVMSKMKKWEFMFEYCTEELGWDLNDKETKEKYGVVTKLVSLAKGSLAMTTKAIEEIAENHGLELKDDEAKVVLDSIKMLSQDIVNIDFDDMIYLPHVVEEMEFPKFDFVFVDECQDLNIAQQEIAKKCCKENGGRFVAVGDPNQAIYFFAGAEATSFQRLQSTPNTVTLPLNECYRCTKAIIKFTQEKTGSTIVAHESCPEGEQPRGYSVNDIYDGDFIMCRTTAPLVKFCFYLLANGKAANIVGRSIEKTLNKIITKSKTITLRQFYQHLTLLEGKLFKKLQKQNPDKDEEEIKELREYTDQADMHEVFSIVANKSDIKTTNELSRAIKKLFSDSPKNGITLSTIHKAKGLEFDRCFIIERHLMPHYSATLEHEIQQEINLEYVCYTRAKKTLGWISDWTSKKQKDKTELFEDQE